MTIRFMVLRIQDRTDRRRPGQPFGPFAVPPVHPITVPDGHRVALPEGFAGAVTRRVGFVGEQAPAMLAATVFNLKSEAWVIGEALVTPGISRADPAAVAVLVAELGLNHALAPSRVLSAEALQASHEIVVLGSRIVLASLEGVRAHQERWPLDEPAERGIHGLDRLRLIRDGIELRVNTLIDDLGVGRVG